MLSLLSYQEIIGAFHDDTTTAISIHKYELEQGDTGEFLQAEGWGLDGLSFWVVLWSWS